jgi:hypothetical protein
MRSRNVQGEGSQGAGHTKGMRGAQVGQVTAEGQAGSGSPRQTGTLAQTVHNMAPLTLTGTTPTIKATNSVPTQATLVAITRRTLAFRVARQAQRMQLEDRQDVAHGARRAGAGVRADAASIADRQLFWGATAV